ncbi:MAG: hypothetical protein ACK4YK_07965 [Dolichospermum sp.]
MSACAIALNSKPNYHNIIQFIDLLYSDRLRCEARHQLPLRS